MTRVPHTPSAPPAPDDELVLADDLEAIVSLVEVSEPSLGVRDRLLGALRVEGRLERFADRIAALLDVDLATARDYLDRAGSTAAYEAGPFPGVSLYHVDGGPSVAFAITGFVRIEGGSRFPTHGHLGEETVVIVQGSCFVEETGEILRAGDEIRTTSDEVHATIARPGPDLVYLAIAFGGIRVGDAEFLPGDPNI